MLNLDLVSHQFFNFRIRTIITGTCKAVAEFLEDGTFTKDDVVKVISEEHLAWVALDELSYSYETGSYTYKNEIDQITQEEKESIANHIAKIAHENAAKFLSGLITMDEFFAENEKIILA